MRRSVLVIMVILLTGVFVFGAFTQNPASAAPITISYLNYTPSPKALPHRRWAPLWVDKVNERAKGELVVKYSGGPEVISQFDQAKAVAKGAVDMALNPCSFHSSFVPGSTMIRLPHMTVPEQREKGALEWIREVYARKGLFFVGWTQPINTGYFIIVSSKPIRKKEDFKGLKLGASPPFLPVFKALGAVGVTEKLEEYYPGVERGVTDGNAITIDLYTVLAEYEVAPYVLDHPFWNCTTVTIMNLKKWNSLPDHLKKLIEQVQLEQEMAWPDIFDEENAKMVEKSKAGGAKYIQLSPEDEKWFRDATYYAGWAYDKERTPTDIYNGFKELYGFEER